MNMDKLMQATFESIIENEEELFGSDNKMHLAMAAAMVQRHTSDLLARATKSTAKLAFVTATETAEKIDDKEEATDKWHKLFVPKLQKDDNMDALLTALSFIGRYVEELGEVAARKMIDDEPGSFGAKFGRN